jgi:heme-degrading monooxygenase HmoA
MYAHVNIWPLNEAGAKPDDAAAQALATQLIQQPGFHSYTLVRTGTQEVVALTMFESEAALHSAMHAVAEVVHQQVDPLTAGPPEQRAGEVLFHAHIVEQERHGRGSSGS